jgi:hypothetical protein
MPSTSPDRQRSYEVNRRTQATSRAYGDGSGPARCDEYSAALELTDAAVGGARTTGLCALGAIRFTEGVPDARFTVSVGAIREFVRQARPSQSPGVQTLEAARIVGRVAAHEIGQYLLGNPRHHPTGLMRSRFDGAELLAPRLEPFAPPPRHQLTAGFVRLGGDRAW